MTDNTTQAELVEVDEDTARKIQLAEIRNRQINAIHALAEWLSDHPNVPIQYGLTITNYLDMESARDARRDSYGWDKTHDDYSFVYRQTFTDEDTAAWSAVRYEIRVAKSDATCKRVQTGTRHVDAVEAHDEPVYKWVCDGDVSVPLDEV